MREKKLEDMTLEELWTLFPIELKAHQELWETQFRKEKAYLETVLNVDKIRWIEHIGSTAVKSISAKPTVDLLIELNKGVSIASFIDPLKQAGYIVMSQSTDRVSLNKGYTPKGYADQVFHLHLRHFNDHDELYFRDYLVGFLEEAKRYEALKLKLAEQYRHHRDDYTNQKTEFITQVTAKAKAYYKDKYER